MSLLVFLMMLSADGGPSACHDNLCGMDSYCSCHGDGAERRCWSTAADCEADRACCARGDCHGMVEDRCVKHTRAERKRRAKEPAP